MNQRLDLGRCQSRDEDNLCALAASRRRKRRIFQAGVDEWGLPDVEAAGWYSVTERA